MTYELLYSHRSITHLSRIPERMRDEVEERLFRLAESPTRVSVRIASPPFPPDGQLYHFVLVDKLAERWFFTVIFRYSHDETAIHVLSVTWRELDS